MLAGEHYHPLGPELVKARDRARDLCQELNTTRERDQDARRSILKQLFGRGGESVWMQPPFFCDYGSNILENVSVGVGSGIWHRSFVLFRKGCKHGFDGLRLRGFHKMVVEASLSGAAAIFLLTPAG
jgi:hypothetical protein